MQPEALCEMIRQKCAVRHWYGADKRWSPAVAEDDARRFGFEFPPVTEEQCSQAEAMLGFSLPSELRILYTQLANGGFGPDLGFLRLIGESSPFDRTVIDIRAASHRFLW